MSETDKNISEVSLKICFCDKKNYGNISKIITSKGTHVVFERQEDEK